MLAVGGFWPRLHVVFDPSYKALRGVAAQGVVSLPDVVRHLEQQLHSAVKRTSVPLRKDEPLVVEVLDRIAESLKSKHHVLELCLPRIGRLTFPKDRKHYTWILRQWEPIYYTVGRDALDPDADAKTMENMKMTIEVGGGRGR